MKLSTFQSEVNLKQPEFTSWIHIFVLLVFKLNHTVDE